MCIEIQIKKAKKSKDKTALETLSYPVLSYPVYLLARDSEREAETEAERSNKDKD